MNPKSVESDGLAIRPYEMLCIMCQLGAAKSLKRLPSKRLDKLFQVIRKNPRVPVQFVEYTGDKFSGRDKDSPCGVLFHMYQDEVIKSRFIRFHGKWERARTGLGKLFDLSKHVPNTEGICWFDPKAAPAWRGCPRAGKGCYEHGRALLRPLAADILPAYNSAKTQEARDAIKAQSSAAVLKAKVIRLFPNHLFYVIHTYLQAETRRDVPVSHDNLWEPGEAMRRNPNIPVMLVPDHCMVCPPCGGYDLEGSGLCQINPLHMKPAEKSSAMNGLVGLSILRTLGLEYYQPLPAHRMLQLARERITPDHIVFTYAGSPPGYFPFERALHDGLGFLEAFKNPRAVLRRVETLLADRRVRALLPADEREHVSRTLAQARRCLEQGRRQEAYGALTESAFAHTWKQYMELIPLGYARLPKTIRAEPDGAAPDRVLKATVIRRHAPRKGPVSPIVYSTGFVTMVNVNRPAIAETGIRVGYDRERLVVDLVCADPKVREVKAEARIGTDLASLGRRYDRREDDALRFIVQPSARLGDRFQFVVNPKGVKLGERVLVRDGNKKIEYIDETGWTATPYRTATTWRVVLNIPFSIFGVRSKQGATWRMNVHRFFRNSLLDHHSWAPTTAWNMDDPNQCGRLVFEQEEP